MDANAVSDDELYDRYKNGDTSAYDELILRYKDGLTAYLNVMLHSVPDAEDMMIEAFAYIMEKKPQISRGNFKAYLFQAGRRYAIRLKTRSHRKDEFSLEGLDLEPIAAGSVEKEAITDELREILHRCMERIDPAMREALYLVYIDGLSHLQAARVMKVVPKKINNLITRGKQKLREELKKEGISDPNI